MLRVLHLTDTHVVAAQDTADPPTSFSGSVTAIQGRTTTETLADVLAAVAAAGVDPDLVLHTGDVADDGERGSYEVIVAQLSGIGAPIVAVPGNHDDPVAMADVFGHPDQPVRSVPLGPWTVVAVNDSTPDQDHGTLPAPVLVALHEALVAAPGPVLLALHHAPRPICPHPSCALVDAPGLLALLGRHPQVKAVASGHLHAAAEEQLDGVAYLLGPSTALQIVHEHPLPEHNLDPTPLGAWIIDLHDDGTVTSELVWTS